MLLAVHVCQCCTGEEQAKDNQGSSAPQGTGFSCVKSKLLANLGVQKRRIFFSSSWIFLYYLGIAQMEKGEEREGEREGAEQLLVLH